MLHMEFRFGYTGLTTGEAALVKVRLVDPANDRERLPRTPTAEAASLEAPDAVGRRDAGCPAAIRA